MDCHFALRAKLYMMQICIHHLQKGGSVTVLYSWRIGYLLTMYAEREANYGLWGRQDSFSWLLLVYTNCLGEFLVISHFYLPGTLWYISGTSPAAPRTHASVLKDVRSAYAQGKRTRGIRGPLPLLLLKGFNLVWCMPLDYMHCVLEGVTKQITELWIKGTSLHCYIEKN